MSQQDAAKEQANTRKNVRIVSVFTAAAIGLVGVLVILYAWQLPPLPDTCSLPTMPTCGDKRRLSARR